MVLNRVGSMMTAFFVDADKVANYDDVKCCDTALFGRFFNECLQHGLYLAPSQFEAAFVSAAHTEKDINAAVDVAKSALQAL